MEQQEEKLQYNNDSPGYERVLARAQRSGISLDTYREQGYDVDQLEGICFALEIGVDIAPYLSLEYRGASIREIALGIRNGLDVRIYANPYYTWRKMREIRLGMEQGLDYTIYNDPLYSYWQMREIRLGLKEGLDVSEYTDFMYTAKEMRDRRILLRNRKNIPKISGNWKIINHPDYELCISPDALRVYLSWKCKRSVENVGELLTILKQYGICFGIDTEALQTIVIKSQDEKHQNKKTHSVLVARGVAAKNGKDGYYEWKFQVKKNIRSKLDANGNLDFSKMIWFDLVKKGQTLAIYHFAEPAIDGRNVYAEVISAKAGREKHVLKGRGFLLAPDMHTYIATIDGQVLLKNKELIVDEVCVMEQLDHTDGEFVSDRDVYISGNVEGPVSIEVGGDLIIEGFVQNARIKCNGNLILKRGINNISEETTITVGASVVSRFFEYVNLKTEGNIYFGMSLNSNLFSYGEIVSYGKKGGISGGSCYSEKGFLLQELGNEAGNNTEISFGNNVRMKADLILETEHAKEISHIIAQLYQAREQLIFGKQNDPELLHRIEDTLSQRKKELKSVKIKIETMKQRQLRACRSKVIVERKLYDNVRVKFLDSNELLSPSGPVQIQFTDKHFVLRKLSKG